MVDILSSKILKMSKGGSPRYDHIWHMPDLQALRAIRFFGSKVVGPLTRPTRLANYYKQATEITNESSVFDRQYDQKTLCFS